MKTKIIRTIQRMIIIPMIILILLSGMKPKYVYAADANSSVSSDTTNTTSDEEDANEEDGNLLSFVTDIALSLLAYGVDTCNRLLNKYLANEDFFSSESTPCFTNDTNKANYIENHPIPTEVPEESVVKVQKSDLMETYGIPNIKVSPEEIFSGGISLVNANFFETNEDDSTANKLKGVVSAWYNTLRIISVVGLLCVLVYVGIRIILSSTAGDKAKYKTMLGDWVVGLCLVFCLHYIMAFTTTIIQTLLDGIVGEGTNDGSVYIRVMDGDKIDTIEGTPVEFSTNLAGYMRLLVESDKPSVKGSTLIMYIAIIFYTIYFGWVYLKRLLTLTFLTIIAPLVALTYPLDKIKDNKAQAFNYWFKEYIVNSILPVIHLILYTVFVTSAMDLVIKSPIYAIAAMAFIVPAEKIVKEMFGVKSNTAPGLDGFGKGAIASQAVSALKNASKSRGDKKQSAEGQSKIRQANNTMPVEGSGVDALAEGVPSTAAGSQSQQPETQQQLSNAEAPDKAMAASMLGEDEFEEKPKETTPLDERTINQSGNQSTSRKPTVQGRAPKGTARRNLNAAIQKRLNPTGKKFGVTRKILKSGAKGVVRLGGAAIGAGIGLAAGMVSGDLNDVWKGAVGGAGIGAGITTRMTAGLAGATGSISKFASEVKYGQKGAAQIRTDKEFMRNEDNVQHLRAQGLGNKEIQERLEEYKDYSHAGVADISEMDRLHKIRDKIASEQFTGTDEEKAEFAKKQTIELARLSNTYDKGDFRGKKIDETKADLSDRFKDATKSDGRKLSDTQVENATQDTYKKLRKIKTGR